MNIEKIAKKAGVVIVECRIGWGGTFAYKCKDEPNTTICGFKTEAEAIKAWAKNKFGEQGYKVLVSLIEENKKLKEKLKAKKKQSA